MLGVSTLAGGWVQAADSPGVSAVPFAPPVVRLNLSEAMALFLKQNLDLLIAKYGMEFSKGQQITARLFPNPVAQIGNVASFTQGNTLAKTGGLTMQVQQLFELAGKRGYRIESAGFGVQSVEADFEDAVLHEAAVLWGAECLVSRNGRDFRRARLPVYAPGELEAVLGV